MLEGLIGSGLLTAGSTGLARLRGLSINRRNFVAGMGASALATTQFPCRAHAANVVNFFGWQDYDTALDVNGFFKAEDIELRSTYMTDNAEIIATAQNGGIGNMDIATPDLMWGALMVELGLFEELDLTRIPNYESLFAPFKTVPGTRYNDKQYCLPISWGNIVLMYNADVIKEPPTSWLDLEKPEYAGRVGMASEMSHLVIPFTMAIGKTATPTKIEKSLLDEVYAKLTDIKKKQVRSLAPTFGDLATQFASGEIIIAPAWEPVSVWAGADAPPLKWSHPVEGSFSFIDSTVLMKDSPNAEVAYKLLNQSLSAEAQAKAANKNYTGVTVSGAVQLLDAAPKALYPYDDIDGFWAQKGGMPPLWPMEKSGDLVTVDEVFAGWETFLKA